VTAIQPGAPSVVVPPHQRRWPASVAVLIALVLQVFVPEVVSIGPRWLFPGLQGALLAPLVASNPVRLTRDHPLLRILAISSAAGVMLINGATLTNLVAQLLRGVPLAPRSLLIAAVAILTTNVIASSVLLWELDRGGPFARDPDHQRAQTAPDLVFPRAKPQDGETFRPAFVDYLFVGFTMSTAFSPTDTMPVSARAKIVFMIGASIAIATIALVAARAANIL
jgi:hypothetical protein